MLEETSNFEEIISSLHSSPLFSKVKSEALKDMLKNFTLVKIKKSTEFDNDLNMKYFYVILKGRLKLMQIDPKTGKSITLFLLNKGDIFDIFPLLDGKEHIVQPIAIDDMIILRTTLNQAREWMKCNPDFNASFLPYIGNKLRELEYFSKSMVFHDTLTRLSNLILRFTVPQKDQNTYPVKLINNLSHESLAELIGTSRSVLSTQMQKLKKEGAIASKNASLVVKDIKKLIKE